MPLPLSVNCTPGQRPGLGDLRRRGSGCGHGEAERRPEGCRVSGAAGEAGPPAGVTLAGALAPESPAVVCATTVTL